MDFRVDEVVVLVDWSAKRCLAPLAARCAADAAAHTGTPANPAVRWSGVLVDASGISIAATAREVPTGVLPCPRPDVQVLVGERVGGRDGRYQLISWDAGRRELSVEGDVLGIVPLYLWRSGEQLVLASTLKAFRLLPFVPIDVDPEGMGAAVALGFPLGTTTVLRGIRALPADAVVRFTSDGMTTRPRHSVAPGGEVEPGFAGRRADAIVEAFDTTLATSTAEWLRGRQSPLVSLSGGLDSRLALGYVVAADAQPTAATWGFPNVGDARIAGRVAAALRVPHRMVPLDVSTRWTPAELGGTGWRLETFGAVNLPFYAREWARFLATLGGRPAVHGFVGDSLGGANVLTYGVDRTTAAGPAAGAEMAFHAFIRRRAPEAVTRITTKAFTTVLRDTLADTALAHYRALPDAHAYQRLIWFDLLARQRRYIASSASRLLASYGPIVLPYYSTAQLELALRLPADALLDRAAARRLLARRFPALARIPLTGESQLPAYPARWREWTDRPARTIRARRRHWAQMFRTFGNLLGAHTDVVVTTLRQAAPMLEAHFDVEALCGYVVDTACSQPAQVVPQGDRRFIMRVLNVAAFLGRLTERADARSPSTLHLAR